MSCQWSRLFVSLTLGVLMTTGYAASKDPLDTPARMSLQKNARLLAVASAGDRLVAVGPGGRILVSIDYGTSWQQVVVPVSSDLVAVHFLNPMQGWVVGHDGVVLHSSDGGMHWISQLDGRQAALVTKAYFGAQDQNSVDKTARLEAERFVEEGPDKPFFDVLFVNQHEGFVVGAFNLAMHTADGGKTWTPLNDRTDNPGSLHLYAITQDGEDIYLTGEQGLLRRWDRTLQRFQSLTSPYKGSFFGIVGKPGCLIAFGMRGNAFRSRDRGQTWQKLKIPGSAGITSGAFLKDGTVVLTTQAGKLLISKKEGDDFFVSALTSARPYFGVTEVDAHRVVIVGEQGINADIIP